MICGKVFSIIIFILFITPNFGFQSFSDEICPDDNQLGDDLTYFSHAYFVDPHYKLHLKFKECHNILSNFSGWEGVSSVRMGDHCVKAFLNRDCAGDSVWITNDNYYDNFNQGNCPNDRVLSLQLYN